MKIIVTSLFVLFVNVAAAADFTLDLDLSNRQIFDSGAVVSEDLYKKANLSVNFESGWYLNFWAGLDNDGFHEIDYTVGYSFGLPYSSAWSVDLSLNWYDVNTIGSDTEEDMFVPIVKVTYAPADSPWSVYLASEPTFVNGNSDLHGAVTYLGGNVNLLSFYGVNLQVGGRAGYDSTFKTDQWYGRLDLQPEFAIDQHTTVRFLGISHWEPEHTPSETMINILGVSHQF